MSYNNYNTDETISLAAQLLASAAKNGHLSAGGYKNDPVSTSGPYGPYAHSQTGLFNTPGTFDRVYSAIMMPLGGLWDRLPRLETYRYAPEGYGGVEVPLFTTITGVTKGNSEVRANQRATPCDAPPLAGYLKACVQTAPYGMWSGRISLDIHQLGRLLTLAEPLGLTLANNPPMGSNLMPGFLGTMGMSPFNEIGKKMKEGLTSWARFHMPLIWSGTPANNNAGGGYKEPVGFDILINTGKVDALGGQACPRMDSIISSFGDQLVTAANTGIVAAFEDMVRRIWYRAKMMGISNTPETDLDVEAHMTWDLFSELIRAWPVKYYTESLTQMAAFANGRVNFSGTELTDARDDMWNNRYLPVFGRRITVVIDDTITETDRGNGVWESEIKFITMRAGGTDLVGWDVRNQDHAQARAVENILGGQTWTSDGGAFRWYFSHQRGCVDLVWETEPRWLSITPYLNGRLTDVRFSPYSKSESWNPDSAYFLNGGRTNTNTQTWYTDWSTETPVAIGEHPYT